jgi:hypothetical protein
MRKVRNIENKRSFRNNVEALRPRKEFVLNSPTSLRAGLNSLRNFVRKSLSPDALPEGSLSFQTRFARLNHPFGVDGQASFVSLLFSAQTSLSLVFAERSDPQGRRAVRILLPLRGVKNLILRSRCISFGNATAFGSVPPKWDPTEPNFREKESISRKCKCFLQPCILLVSYKSVCCCFQISFRKGA